MPCHLEPVHDDRHHAAMVTAGRRQRHLECTLHLVADRAGNLTAVWIEGLISSERLMGSHYDAARGAWTVPAQLDDWVTTSRSWMW